MARPANTFSSVISRVQIPRLQEGHEPGCERVGFCVCYVDETACWSWTGYADSKAPMVKWNGTMTTVVRVLSDAMIGGNPRSTRRTCGNSFCVNPMHGTSLEYGTSLPYLSDEEAEEIFATEGFSTSEYRLSRDDRLSQEAIDWLAENDPDPQR